MLKDQMWSGDWTVIIEGLTFAWMRTFSIIAAPPVVITSTPTATFTVTSTPSTTINTTITNVYSTTLPPATTTVPSVTLTRTITTTPSQVTVFLNSTSTRTHVTKVFSSTVSTTIITTSCRTQPPRKDPTCTIHPTKASLAAASNPTVGNITVSKATISPVPRFRGGGRERHMRGFDERRIIEPRGVNLVKRGPGKKLFLPLIYRLLNLFRSMHHDLS